MKNIIIILVLIISFLSYGQKIATQKQIIEEDTIEDRYLPIDSIVINSSYTIMDLRLVCAIKYFFKK